MVRRGRGPELEAALFSQRSDAAPVPSMLATVRAGWAATRHEAAAMFANTQKGVQFPPPSPQGGGRAYPPVY